MPPDLTEGNVASEDCVPQLGMTAEISANIRPAPRDYFYAETAIYECDQDASNAGYGMKLPGKSARGGGVQIP